MYRSRSERQELAQRFAADLVRMRACLFLSERADASDDDLIRAWTDYSERSCAGWLQLPKDDAELCRLLERFLPSTWADRSKAGIWRARLQDAGDGSGDCLLELPDELLDQVGWKTGDILDLSVSDDGTLVLWRLE